MTQRELRRRLSLMRKVAERAVQNIAQISRNLSDEKQALQEMVTEYNAKHVELLKQALQARKMTWCTKCHALTPESEAKFLHIEGKRYSETGDCYGFERFSDLHRACPKCYERAMDKHMWMGPYDTMAKDQASFYAYPVEEHKDGFYYKNGTKPDDAKSFLDDMPNLLVDELAEELNLPPRIEVTSLMDPEVELIIHEQVKMAKAS